MRPSRQNGCFFALVTPVEKNYVISVSGRNLMGRRAEPLRSVFCCVFVAAIMGAVVQTEISSIVAGADGNAGAGSTGNRPGGYR
jgi:hypothetical protein